jgi:DNA-binding IclR family transcriptional regulator
MKILTNMGGSKMKALTYILENINPHNNEFAGTLREIVEATGLSQTTIQETIKLLLLHEFFIKIRPSNYMVNPNCLMKGNSRKHRNLLLRYTKLEGNNSIGLNLVESEETTN